MSTKIEDNLPMGMYDSRLALRFIKEMLSELSKRDKSGDTKELREEVRAWLRGD